MSTVRAAVVQIASCVFDRDATLRKIDKWAAKAAAEGAQLSLVARIGMETEFPLSPSGSVRRCVRTQAVRARSLCSGLFGRVGSP